MLPIDDSFGISDDDADRTTSREEPVQPEDTSTPSLPILTTQVNTSSGMTTNNGIDIALGPTESPVQPSIRFPQRHYGSGRPRSFNPSWYTKYTWLEYSIKHDAAFCYACRFFALGTAKDDAFIQTGFRDWKHALGKDGIIAKHDNSSFHKAAMCGWNMYVVNSAQHTSVACRLDKSRQELIKSNRYYIKCVAEILLVCAQQDLPLRGQRVTRVKQPGQFSYDFTAAGIS